MPDQSPPQRAAPDELAHEARLEAVLEAVSDGFYALDKDWRYVVFNRAAEEYFGVSRDRVLGQVIWDIFPQGRGTHFERRCRAAMDERVSATFETPSRLRPDRIVELRILPMRDGGIAVSLTDVTERRRAEEAMRAALERSEEILESISDAFYAVDAEWRFTYVNRVAEAWFSRSREALIGKVCWDEVPGIVDGPIHKAHLAAARKRKVERLEATVPLSDRWVELSIFPSGSGLAVYFRDITGRKEAEARQRLLVNELNHRVKNALATVQAIAAQSLRGEGVSLEARERFTERLMALARANDVLLAENWRGASLQAIAAQVASPHADTAESERFLIEGGPAHLAPAAATAMALALHELATNASKYGALSVPTGRVELRWALQGGEADRSLCLTWRESGGPPVAKPETTGFGTRLITQGLSASLHAKVRIDYAPSGLVCTITAPVEDSISERPPATDPVPPPAP